MKRFTTFAIAVFAAISLYAGAAFSVLNIRSADNSPIKVSLNGRFIPAVGNQIQIPNVAPGNTLVHVYKVNYHWGNEQLIPVYTGNVHIQPFTETFATLYNSRNGLFIDQVLSLRNRPGRGIQPHATSGQCSPWTDMTTQPVMPIFSAGPMAMDNFAFQQLLQTMQAASFENTRLNIFRQALSMNYFTSSQVRLLMDVFTFESYKIEVAKLAYNRTVDPSNYFLINNGFTFSSSVNQLNRYLASL